MDGAGNIALGYEAQSADVARADATQSVRYVGRLADDPLGALSQGEYVLAVAGPTAESLNRREPGSIRVDPTDDCTFWFASDSTETASSVVGRFWFESCAATPVSDVDRTLPAPGATEAVAGVPPERRDSNARSLREEELPPQAGSAGSVSTAVPPPTAAALAKYGDMPVSLYTGTPNIDIPLHVLKGRNLSVPISLSYHASGVKVAETPGWVGQGWSLNAGGVITRTVRGLADDGLAGYYNTSHRLEAVWNHVTDEYLTEVLELRADPEPDDFFFNFAGHSGRFVMGTGDIRTIPHSKLRFEFDRGVVTIVDRPVYGVTRWTVTDESGTKYIFEDMEWFYQRDASDCTLCGHASSWYLTKIQSANGSDEITFDYERTTEPIVYPQQTYREEIRIRTTDCEGPTLIVQENKSENLPIWLNKITSAQGSVELETSSGREDLPEERKLDRIVIKSWNGDTARAFRLTYGYFGSGANSRLRLNRVTEQPRTGTDSPPYVFTYDESYLPDRLSYGVDHWGFYNGQDRNATPLPREIITNPFNGKLELHDGADREPHPEHPEYLLAGALKQIQYPTGGTTRFEYEPHTYSHVGTWPVKQLPGKTGTQFVSRVHSRGRGEEVAKFTIGGPGAPSAFVVSKFELPNIDICSTGPCLEVRIETTTGEVIYQKVRYETSTDDQAVPLEAGKTYRLIAATLGQVWECENCRVEAEVYWQEGGSAADLVAGGLRIRQITDHDGLSSHRDRVRVFEYTDGVNGGVLTSEPRYHFANVAGACRYLSRSSMPVVGPGMTRGSHIGYPFVAVKYGDASAPGGRTEHVFTSARTHPDRPERDVAFWPFAGRTTFDYARGFEGEKFVYNGAGLLQQYTKNARFDANDQAEPDARVHKGYRALSVKAGMANKIGDPDVFYRQYNVISSWLHPVRETVTVYDQVGNLDNGISTVREFGYTNLDHLQRTSLTEKNSDDTVRLTETRYAIEEYPDMQAANLWSPVYSTTIQKGSADVESKSWTTFALNGDGFWRPAATWAWVGDGTEADTTAPEDPENDAEAVKVAEYVSYDGYGRVEEQRDARRSPTTFEYGGGLNEDLFLTAVHRGDLTNSYQYHPIYNQVQQITESGFVTNYEYDAFGRLEFVKNAAGEKLSQIAYAYTLASSAQPNSVQTTTYLSQDKTTQVIEYVDGLGRPVQRVQRNLVDNVANHVVTATEYDRFGRVAKTFKPYFHSSTSYDPDYVTNANSDYPDANGRAYVETTYLADPLQRVDKTLPEGETVYSVNRDYFNVSSQGVSFVLTTDETGKRKYAFTDKFGNTVQTVADVASTYFDYDVLGNPTRVKAPTLQETTYHYDPLQRLVRKTSSDAGTLRYRYDRNGNPRFSQDARQVDVAQPSQRRVSFTLYDLHNRPTTSGEGMADFAKLDPDATADLEKDSANWLSLRHYDTEPSSAGHPWSLFAADVDAAVPTHLEGRLAATAQKSGGKWQIVLYSYRSDSAVLEKHVLSEGLAGTKTKFTYSRDLQGNATSVHTQVGTQSFYHFYDSDDRGLLAKVYTGTTAQRPQTPDVSFTYTPGGAKDHVRFLGGTDIPYAYTVRDWMKTIDDLDNTARPFAAKYSYYRNGTMESAEFNQPSSPAADKRYKYVFSYNSMNYLVAADYQGASSYDMDSIGYDVSGNIKNLILRQENGAKMDELTFEYHAGTHRVSKVTDAIEPTPEAWDAEDASFGYDANGNVTSVGPPYNLSAITYDPRQLPETMVGPLTTVSYCYSADGERYYKHADSRGKATGGVVAEHYVLDGAVPIAIFDTAGAPKHWNIVAGDQVVGRVVGSTKLFYVQDNVGSTRAVVNGSGQVVETSDFYPFGLAMPGRGKEAATSTRERFTGKERDRETGLDYFGARFYMAALGRFMAVDPSADQFAGVSPYNYVLNNPLTMVDPDGRCSKPAQDNAGEQPCPSVDVTKPTAAAAADATKYTQSAHAPGKYQWVATPEKSLAVKAKDFFLGGLGELPIGLGLTDTNFVTGENKSLDLESSEALGGSLRADSFVEGADWVASAATVTHAALKNGVRGVLGQLHPEKLGAGGRAQAYAKDTGKYLPKGSNTGLPGSAASDYAIDKIKDVLQILVSN